MEWIDVNDKLPGHGVLVWVWIADESWLTLALHEDLYNHRHDVEALYEFRHFRQHTKLTGVTKWMRVQRPDAPVPVDTLDNPIV